MKIFSSPTSFEFVRGRAATKSRAGSFHAQLTFHRVGRLFNPPPPPPPSTMFDSRRKGWCVHTHTHTRSRVTYAGRDAIFHLGRFYHVSSRTRNIPATLRYCTSKIQWRSYIAGWQAAARRALLNAGFQEGFLVLRPILPRMIYHPGTR